MSATNMQGRESKQKDFGNRGSAGGQSEISSKKGANLPQSAKLPTEQPDIRGTSLPTIYKNANGTASGHYMNTN